MIIHVRWDLLLAILSVYCHSVRSDQENRHAVDICECPGDATQPVCGTDGKTYDNFCKIRCASNTTVGLGGKCRGACPCEPPSPLLSLICGLKNNCPPQIPKGQLCGTDQITYNDACVFLCSQQKDQGLGVQCGGACPCPKAEGPCSKCPEEYRPLCGSNGVTYGNQCMFSCARITNANLFPACRSECPCTAGDGRSVTGDPTFVGHLKRVFLIPF